MYDALCADYHWFHPADAPLVGTLGRVARHRIGRLPAGSAVLDASCGPGWDAVALTRLGLDVTASDASAAMVEATRRHARSRGVELGTHLADWRHLTDVFGAAAFDAVLCTGNSLAHLDAGDMEVALGEFAAILVPGGEVLVDTHHWEEVLAAGDRVVADPAPVVRGDSTAMRSYRFSIGERGPSGEVTCRMGYVLALTTGAVTRVRRYEASFHPFGVAELVERARRAGLGLAYCDAEAGEDRYTAVFERR